MESVKVEDLLESRIFQCKICNKRLSPPIMDVQNIGTICGKCFHQNSHTNAKENLDIPSILMKLHMSCNYSKKGCSFQGSYTEIIAHEEYCSHQEKTCPFTYIHQCNCAVPFKTIPEHIKKNHPEYILYYSTNSVKIEINLTQECNDLRLLTINNDNYILRTKSDSNSLYFIIYYFKGNENRTFSISHENEDFCTKSKDCNLLPESCLGPIFDASNATSFDLTSLQKCFDIKITTIIKISTPSFEIANKKLLKYMECPVCNEYMIQQIRQCAQGHSLCKVCRNKLQECPLCKAAFGSSRNFALESITSEIFFPCKNFGCMQYIPGDAMEKHESECNFKYYQCPFLIKLNCKWKGLHGDIREHLLTEHPEYTKFHDCVQRNMVLDYVNHKYDTICIILGENIFKVCVCVNGTNKLFLTYGLYGPACAASKFFWETGIYHKNNDRHKFVIKDVCTSYQSTNYRLDIEGYGVDDTIYFYHKVTSNCSRCI